MADSSPSLDPLLRQPVLAMLPHIDASAIHPAAGPRSRPSPSPGRDIHRPEEAVELLRRLPYMRGEVGERFKWLAPKCFACAPAVWSTTSPTSVTAPGPTQTGIAATCDKFTEAQSGDRCESFAARNNITPAQLYEWNSVLGLNGANCNTMLWGDELVLRGCVKQLRHYDDADLDRADVDFNGHHRARGNADGHRVKPQQVCGGAAGTGLFRLCRCEWHHCESAVHVEHGLGTER
ncbi:hypothetical protein Hte_010280 [Hypoxylon texense]